MSQSNSGDFIIKDVPIGLDAPLFLIAGPCVIESLETCLEIAENLVEIEKQTGVRTIYKASFDKANRTSLYSFRGLGFEKGMEILGAVKRATHLPILTDVHEIAQVTKLATSSEFGAVVDCIQIPAFLCRQTDLVVACGLTHKPINIKKGQFLAPGAVENILEKIWHQGNRKTMVTERGTFFGYNQLVNDMTGIPIMQKQCPVVFDATHSTQCSGSLISETGGRPEMAPVLARAGIAAGANGLFLEVHIAPATSKSDTSTILPITWVKDLVLECKEIHEIVHKKVERK